MFAVAGLTEPKGILMKSRNSTKAARETAAIAGSLMLAPMVAFMRLPLMAMEARGAKSLGVETMNAVSEKSTAMAEGAFAAQMSLVQSASLFWPEVFSGRTPSMFSGAAVERSVNAALKPASRRVTANFRRLTLKA